jgi:hypothetical protein
VSGLIRQLWRTGCEHSEGISNVPVSHTNLLSSMQIGDVVEIETLTGVHYRVEVVQRVPIFGKPGVGGSKRLARTVRFWPVRPTTATTPRLPCAAYLRNPNPGPWAVVPCLCLIVVFLLC